MAVIKKWKKLNTKLKIPGNGKEIIAFSAEFQRVNILLGGNGTGKSKILGQLKGHINSFGDTRPLIYVEGGRTMVIPDSLQLDNRTFNQYSTYQQTESVYKRKRQTTISQRIKDALILLQQKEQEINNVFAKDAHDWDLNGRQTNFPIKPQAPLERLFEIFNEVFPSITLKFISAQKHLKCYKNGNEYPPSQLSDGEKQIFCLLADIFMLTEPNSLILVDEPELNLNPGLACRFWDILENECTNRYNFSSYLHAYTTIGDYINWYNYERIHSALGFKTPVETELQFKIKQMNKSA